MFFVYVIQSLDAEKKRYIGFTADIERRLSAHNSDENRGYTKGRKWKLVYFEAYLSEKDARRRERRLKDDGRARRQLINRIETSLAVS